MQLLEKTINVGGTTEHGRETFVLNLGPQHPATHGVLRVKMEMDGEYVVRAEPVCGYIHRMQEKMGENRTYAQYLPNTSRIDYLSAMTYTHAFVGAFDPIDYRQADPAPFYLIWKGAGERDVVRYPWPYQLAELELVRVEDRFPRAVPPGAELGSAARRGFDVFRQSCLQCHAINGEGGRVGPELNVPQSIVAYRPEAQLRAFIRDPPQFRYTQMPANPHLTDADLDALLAYFRHMSAQQIDPARGTTEAR